MAKMKLIAHRGLTHGPDPSLENSPKTIASCLENGFDCEIDLWLAGKEFRLGHDRPEYLVSKDFLSTPGLWIHAKNLEALRYLVDTQLTYFWHQNDDCVITSNGLIWTFPGKELTDRSVMLLPEWHDPHFVNLNLNCYAICSDYVDHLKNIICT